MPRTTTVEPPGCPPLRAFCCDSLGFVKVLQSKLDGAEQGPLEVVARWGQPGLDLGSVAMSLFPGSKRLAIARKSGIIEVLNTKDGTLFAEVRSPKTDEPREGSDAIVGVHLFGGDSIRQGSLLHCKENGDAAIQSLENADILGRWDVCKSASVLTMDVHHGQKYAAFGGKGLELTLWDFENYSRPLWKAKKPAPDRLQLTPPSFITASAFLCQDNHQKIAAGTAQHQVRIYDVGAQRRHVLAFDYGESPIKALASDPDGLTLYVGTGSGGMACFDTRTGKLLGGFKGKMAGSVRCIRRHPSLPLVASCGLDRFLRVHDVETRELLGKMFLKQPLIGVAFDDQVEPELQKSRTEEQDPLSSTKKLKKKKKSEATGATEEEEEMEKGPPMKLKKKTKAEADPSCEDGNEEKVPPLQKSKKKTKAAPQPRTKVGSEDAEKSKKKNKAVAENEPLAKKVKKTKAAAEPRAGAGSEGEEEEQPKQLKKKKKSAEEQASKKSKRSFETISQEEPSAKKAKQRKNK